MKIMFNLLMVLMGGSMGAACRYAITLLAAKQLGGQFPYGTLTVNMLGCLLIGVTFALADQSDILSSSARLFFMTGFLGSLTTFSTFALETVHSLRHGLKMVSVLNLLLNNLMGLLLVCVGMWITQMVLKGGVK